MSINNNNDDAPLEPPKVFNRRSQLEHLLQQLSRKQMKAFLLDTALHDPDLRDGLLIHFGEYLNSVEPEEAKYRQTLNRMIDKHQNSNHYISGESAQKLADTIQALLESAGKATTPSSKAIDSCMAVITILPRLGNSMDDSEGHIYRLMRIACGVLWECFGALPPERQGAVFNRLLREYAEPIYLDLDLDSFLLTLLKDLAKKNREWQKACLHQQEILLKAAKDDKWRKNYLLEQLNDLLDTWHKPAKKSE